ncbi:MULTISPECIES: hypothetical protein [unclassified Marinitoga]|uniref:hypothetical protein n=1 Tax=unclassified Marinitoga TaxID=2640159 RepID=UPI00065845CA|nr:MULTISPECIES: hypothetical protein [unclassified Marinitoga]KLO22372.1 hypothetical protein X274_08455 [Marinitoga sp. 1155]
MKKITKIIIILTFLFVILFSSITFADPLDGTDPLNITQSSTSFTLNSTINQ